MTNKMIFEDKVPQYLLGRPSYAPEMIVTLLNNLLSKQDIVADIGSGTGILSREFVYRGYQTYAVEPNGNMRKKAEESLATNSNFHSVDATAEDTGLGDKTISLITAASAFHWFDAEKFKQECIRILKKDGVVCIIFNVRTYDDFSKRQCEICRKYCDGFESLTHGLDKTVSLLEQFFTRGYVTYTYDFPLEYSKQDFILRCLSSSYAPSPDSENYEAFISEMNALLDQTFGRDMIKIANQTIMFAGKVQ